MRSREGEGARLMPLTVRNWTRFQHYRNRRPPWIKLHRELLDNFEFIALPFASQALAPRLWLLASESDDGSIPDSAVKLAFRLHCPVADVIAAVKSLIGAGFLDGSLDASAVLAERKQDATPETERETEGEERIAAPAALALPRPHIAGKPKAWSVEACDDWIGAYRGTAPGGRIGKALAPLVKAHGWEAVRVAWRSYLAQTEAEFASPQRFAATFGRWSGSAPAAAPRSGGKPSVVDQTKAVLEKFVREG
jgi:hypothetical protein